MIPIYLCEDNAQQRSQYSRIIEEVLQFEDMDQELFCVTASPHELLKTLKEHRRTGLYFLDIDLQADMDGLELAQKIRAYDPRGYIVFITTHSEMMALTFQYRVEAMDFILKDRPELLSGRIRECMITADTNGIALQKQDGSVIPIKLDNRIVYQNLKDVVFIESDCVPRKIIIHTQNGIRNIPGTLKGIADSLNADFIRCHSSAIVNLQHVSSIDYRKRLLSMDNGEQCPISVRMAGKVKRAIATRDSSAHP